MKKIIVLAIAAIAFIVSGVVANAQYRPGTLSQHRAGLEDENGHTLTDQEVFQLIDEDVYNQTYVGATRQYKTGKILNIVGAATAGVGLVGTIAGTAALVDAIQNGHVTFEDQNGRKVVKEYDKQAALAVVGFAAGATLLAAGDICLSVGIPLQVIGKKRLNWIATEYNHEAVSSANLRIGLTNYGAGLVMNF